VQNGIERKGARTRTPEIFKQNGIERKGARTRTPEIFKLKLLSQNFIDPDET